jgi:hypothetical protein
VVRVSRPLYAAAILLLVGWLATAATPSESTFTAVTTNPGNSFSAAITFCPSVSPIWLTGFESGVVSAAGAAANPASSLFNSVVGGPTINETSRSGNYSLRVSKNTGSSTYVSKTSLGGGSAVTMRLAVRLGSLPAANQAEFVKIDIGTGGDAILGYNNTAPRQFTLGYVGGTQQLGPAAGLVVGQWYRIDLRVDVTTDPHTIDWQVDGVAMSQATISQAADTFAGAINLGSTVNADNYFVTYDDILVSATAADYPIGEGRILPLVPDSYVTKNDFATAYLKETNGTTDLSSTTYQLLDETPMSNNSDYVQQTTGSATDYWAEFGFQDVTRTTCINGVSAVAALHSAGTSANNVRTAIRTGGVERLVHSGDSVATAGLQYRSAVVASVDGSWDSSEISAVTARIGYHRAAGSVPYWDGLRLEYDQAPNAASVYANVVLADNPASYWRLGETGSSGTAGAAAGAPTGNYVNSPIIGVGGAVGDLNTSVVLDGSNDFINFGNIYDFTATAGFTAEAWVRPTVNASTETSGFSVFDTNSASNGTGGWTLRYTCATCTPLGRLLGARGVSVQSGTTLQDYQWYHVALTYDGADLRLYVNGALEATQATTAAVAGGTDPFVIGRHYSTDTLGLVYLKARVDEAAIYNVALGPARIQAHYAAGRP